MLRFVSIYLLVLLSQHNTFIEPSHVSVLKVASMSLALVLFLLWTPRVSKKLIWALFYWLTCLIMALVDGNMRFATIGYLGLFVGTFMLYYNIINYGVFTLNTFSRLLRWLIIAYAICLVLQQICMLVGIHNLPILNISANRTWMQLGKLPSLSLEPSHTAMILTVAFLSYMRCGELQKTKSLSLHDLFTSSERWVTIGFLWTMITMGSSTAFLGLGLLCLYFLRGGKAFLTIPILVLIFFLGQQMGIKQLNRAIKVFGATTTANAKLISETDGSGADRIVPLLNTFTKLDLSDVKTWTGHGTKSDIEKNWSSKERMNRLLPTVDQYGLIAFIVSIIFVYSCCIRRFLSLETLYWFTLGMATIGNIYLSWGTVMMMAGVRYFQEQKKRRYN